MIGKAMLRPMRRLGGWRLLARSLLRASLGGSKPCRGCAVHSSRVDV